MAAETQDQRDPSHLLGLRPPAELAASTLPPQADGPVVGAPVAVARPHYPVISSGWDSEEDGKASKGSDLMTALGAGIVLLLVIGGIGLLIN